MAAPKSTRRTAVAALLWSQGSYWGAVAMAAWALTYMPDGVIRSALTMTPIAPAVPLFFMRTDEE